MASKVTLLDWSLVTIYPLNRCILSNKVAFFAGIRE